MELVDILSPLNQDGSSAVIRVWFKAEGDSVTEGEPLLELETDKVAMEVASPASGRLVARLLTEGDAAPGALLGRIERDDAQADTSCPAPEATPPETERRLSPAVRKLVAQSGIDPAGLSGTGTGGRLTREDVARSVKSEASSHSAGSTRIPHDSMRRRIAEHMQHSVTTAPHVTALFEADCTAILAHRQIHERSFAEQGVKLTPTAYFIQAATAAMQATPRVNSRWHDDALELFHDVHFGIGTALGDHGLVVPVLRNTQSLSLLGIARGVQELTARARSGKLLAEDLRGGTFTMSNHGATGSLLAAPIIINQPQSAILGVGKLEKRVVVREVEGADSIQIRPMCYVTLTIDHRVLDGAETNAWLTRFVKTLEHWPAN